MKNLTNLFFFLIVLSGATNQCYAQSDSVEVYDVVYLKKGGYLKGEIISIDPSNGFMIFRDTKGAKYSLGREEYDSYVEDKAFKSKKAKMKSKEASVLERKTSQFEVSIGFRNTTRIIRETFTADDYYTRAYGDVSGSGTTLSIFAGFGKYFNRRHYIGLNGDLGLITRKKNNYGAGLRYNFHYDGMKSNVALYLPIEFNYSHFSSTVEFEVTDSIPDSIFPNEFILPGYKDLDFSMSQFSVSLGHGFAFMMKNKHSLSMEFSLIKILATKATYRNAENGQPNMKFDGFGFRFGLMFNF